MTIESCNCIVCAEEFNPDELENIVLSTINTTNFKICQACLEISDPADDYRQAREIVNDYLRLSQAKHFFLEAQDILDSRKL